MTRLLNLTLALLLLTQLAFSQADTAVNTSADIFRRIGNSIKNFRLDTADAPKDKITAKIIELRNLKGGFNINEAISFKIEEDRQKNEVPKAELDQLATFFRSGSGKRWLDNATIWIYRNHFTYDELKELVRFYKTSAGQKMASDFPIIMMQSLRAAELIREMYGKEEKK